MSLLLAVGSTSPINGVLSATLGSLGSVSAATLGINAQCSATFDGLSLASQSALLLTGSASATIGALSVASAATLEIRGQSSATLGELMLAASGSSDALQISAVLDAVLGQLGLASAATKVSVKIDVDGGGGGGWLEPHTPPAALPAINGMAKFMLGGLTCVATATIKPFRRDRAARFREEELLFIAA